MLLNNKVNLTVQTLQRMPYYLQYLRKAQENGVQIASATAIANDLKFTHVDI